MKRKNMEKLVPLEYLKKVTNTIPWIWDSIEIERAYNIQANYSDWPKWCYIPIGRCLGLVCDTPDKLLKPGYIDLAQSVAALAPWRVSKEVFVMDADVEAILCEQQDTKIVSDILMNLPYDGFYVKTNNLGSRGGNIDGFFVNLDYDPRDASREIRFTYIDDKLNGYNIPVIMKYETIEENIDYLFSLDERSRDSGADVVMRDLLNKSMQIVLYILAINADINENPVQKKVYKPHTQAKRPIKDKYSEVRKWDVGYRVGTVIRMKQDEKTNEEADETSEASELPEKLAGRSGSHTSKRPHMRRGHWHNYWIGPRAGERKLVLRWIPPMFIGVRGDTPVVLHDVK